MLHHSCTLCDLCRSIPVPHVHRCLGVTAVLVFADCGKMMRFCGYGFVIRLSSCHTETCGVLKLRLQQQRVSNSTKISQLSAGAHASQRRLAAYRDRN